jgi:hypothetical protein
MSIKRPVIVMAAAGLFAVVGSAAVSAQENCSYMHQRVMQAYQTQSPHYGRMLERYNERCLSGSSNQRNWGHDYRHRFYDDHRGYDNDRRGYDNDRWHRG